MPGFVPVSFFTFLIPHQSDSGIINHQGIGIEAIHDTYMRYARGEISIEAAAQAMAETIRTVMQTQTLTVSEKAQLMGVLTEIVGDAELAARQSVNGESEHSSAIKKGAPGWDALIWLLAIQ